MAAMRFLHRLLLFVFLLGTFVSYAKGLTNQVVFFNGFGASAGPSTGLGILNTTLSNSGIPNYLGKVFEWTQRQQAADWVNQQAGNRSTLVLIGHSFGGNSALQLASGFLNGITVDLTIQIDPVKNLYSGANDILPANVDVGINYYQPTGLFDIHGESNVQGATNVDVEVLFSDPSITHTSIDNDSRLHTLIGQNILANLNQPKGDYDHDGDIDGNDFLVWQRNPAVGSLSEWQQRYGTTPLSAASIAVPEPSALGLLIVAAHLTILSRRNTCLRGI